MQKRRQEGVGLSHSLLSLSSCWAPHCQAAGEPRGSLCCWPPTQAGLPSTGPRGGRWRRNLESKQAHPDVHFFTWPPGRRCQNPYLSGFLPKTLRITQTSIWSKVTVTPHPRWALGASGAQVYMQIWPASPIHHTFKPVLQLKLGGADTGVSRAGPGDNWIQSLGPPCCDNTSLQAPQGPALQSWPGLLFTPGAPGP